MAFLNFSLHINFFKRLNIWLLLSNQSTKKTLDKKKKSVHWCDDWDYVGCSGSCVCGSFGSGGVGGSGGSGSNCGYCTYIYMLLMVLAVLYIYYDNYWAVLGCMMVLAVVGLWKLLWWL